MLELQTKLETQALEFSVVQYVINGIIASAYDVTELIRRLATGRAFVLDYKEHDGMHFYEVAA